MLGGRDIHVLSAVVIYGDRMQFFIAFMPGIRNVHGCKWTFFRDARNPIRRSDTAINPWRSRGSARRKILYIIYYNCRKTISMRNFQSVHRFMIEIDLILAVTLSNLHTSTERQLPPYLRTLVSALFHFALTPFLENERCAALTYAFTWNFQTSPPLI